jgi:hypothetical protein
MTAMAYPRALPPRKPTTASTTRSMTYPCGTGRRLDDESCVTTGPVMKAPRFALSAVPRLDYGRGWPCHGRGNEHPRLAMTWKGLDVGT